MQAESNREQIYEYLLAKYKRATIGKKELATELGISPSTVDLYISKGMGIPSYRKLGTAKNAKVVFSIAALSDYLTQTIKTV